MTFNTEFWYCLKEIFHWIKMEIISHWLSPLNNSWNYKKLMKHKKLHEKFSRTSRDDRFSLIFLWTRNYVKSELKNFFTCFLRRNFGDSYFLVEHLEPWGWFSDDIKMIFKYSVIFTWLMDKTYLICDLRIFLKIFHKNFTFFNW